MPNPPHGMGPGKFSTQGRAADHGETAKETGGGELVISTACGSNVRGGLLGDRGLHTKEVEHGSAIYCNATNSVPLQEVSAEAGSLGFSEVVGTGRDQPSRCEEAGGGGRGKGRQGEGEEKGRGGVVGDVRQELKMGNIMWYI